MQTGRNPRSPVSRRSRPSALALPVWCLVAGLLAASPAPAADPADSARVDTEDLPSAGALPGSGEVLPPSPRAVRPGESLRFSVQYGVIHAGSAWLEVPGAREYEGRPVVMLVARAESNGFFSSFYKVRNRIESYWDSTGHYSHRYTEKRREGKYHAESDIRF